jgi:LTXXQ motif family protein
LIKAEETAMKRLALAAALLLATAGSLSQAQSPADHEKHHPDQKEAPAAKPPTPSKGQPGMGGSGMGGSPDMQGMMGGGGMMSMMGGKMPMMDMMQMMGMMRQSGGGMGMATIDRVEGRIAFLRAELKVTDAQNGAWNAFADALRANAMSLGEVRASMMAGAQQNLVDRLALQEKWLTARLEGTRAIKAALQNLIGTLSDDQKRTADELLAPHMGMMAMMGSGMHPGR